MIYGKKRDRFDLKKRKDNIYTSFLDTHICMEALK